MFCTICNDEFCSSCSEKHLKPKKFKDHIFIPIVSKKRKSLSFVIQRLVVKSDAAKFEWKALPGDPLTLTLQASTSTIDELRVALYQELVKNPANNTWIHHDTVGVDFQVQIGPDDWVVPRDFSEVENAAEKAVEMSRSHAKVVKMETKTKKEMAKKPVEKAEEEKVYPVLRIRQLRVEYGQPGAAPTSNRKAPILFSVEELGKVEATVLGGFNESTPIDIRSLGLSFGLMRGADKTDVTWLSVDQNNGTLEGTPTSAWGAEKTVKVLVLQRGNSTQGMASICEAELRVVDERWIDDADKEARRTTLQRCLFDVVCSRGLDLSPEDLAKKGMKLIENKKESAASKDLPKNFSHGKYPFLMIANPNSVAWQEWIRLHGGADTDPPAKRLMTAANELCLFLQAQSIIGDCKVVEVPNSNNKLVLHLLVGLSEEEQKRHKLDALKRQVEKAKQKGTKPELTRTQYKNTMSCLEIVEKGLDVAVPFLQARMEYELKRFQEETVDRKARELDMDPEAFTNDENWDYRALMDDYEPRWDHIYAKEVGGRDEYLALPRWRRTAALTLNYPHSVLHSPERWDFTALCSSARAISFQLPEKLNSVINTLNDMRNKVAHENLIIHDYHTRLKKLRESLPELGGNKEELDKAQQRLDELRNSFLTMAPVAKNSWEEVVKEHQELWTFRDLTKEQRDLFDEIRKTDKRMLIGAPAGSGKSYIAVKLIACIIEDQEKYDGFLPPTLLLAHSRMLQGH